MILKDKVALITGSGAGIGEAIAVAMAEAGAQVISVDIDGEAAQRTSDQAGEFQVKTKAIQADVGDLEDIDRMVQATVDDFGRLDVIVNNAGVTRRAYIMDLKEEDWDRIHRVNAKGVFFCLQRAAKQMIEQGAGCIINTASIAGRGYAGTSNAAYAASKGAVIALTRAASQQLGQHNINVNAVAPGPIDTVKAGANLRHLNETVEYSPNHMTPMGRLGTPREVADAVLFLASDESSYITGHTITVTGGR